MYLWFSIFPLLVFRVMTTDPLCNQVMVPWCYKNYVCRDPNPSIKFWFYNESILQWRRVCKLMHYCLVYWMYPDSLPYFALATLSNLTKSLQKDAPIDVKKYWRKIYIQTISLYIFNCYYICTFVLQDTIVEKGRWTTLFYGMVYVAPRNRAGY